MVEGGGFPVVKVDPPVLDWGRKVVYSASTKHLSVENTCNESVVTVHVAFSSSSQFVPCNNTEVSLGPGEALSLCFVFVPTLLGVSSGELMLQTSSGGFLVEVKGLAVDSPYSDGRVALSGLVDNTDENRAEARRLNFCRVGMIGESCLSKPGVVACEARKVGIESEAMVVAAVLLVLFVVGSVALTNRHQDHDKGTVMEKAPKVLKKASKVAAEGASESHLTIRVLKERVRRRRKRRNRASIFGTVDVSSSQSGNSTPTSPMSAGEFTLIKEEETNVSESPEGIRVSECVMGKPFIPTSTLPPHARAPGWDLGRRKSVEFEEKGDDKYRYDMWGDIFPPIHLMGISDNVGAVNTMAVQKDFSGFFVKGPHTLLRRSPQSYVSCFRSDGPSLE